MSKTDFTDFSRGLIEENPSLVQLLGMCPTLAVTTSVVNAVGMGLSATVVLIASNVFISLLRKIIPNKIRIAAYVVIIATFVTLIQLTLKAYLPTLDKALGIFIPLIVVNCIILGRAEAFASKNNVAKSALDGIGMGLGFTLALIAVGFVREILGNGTIFSGTSFTVNLPLISANPAIIMILPPGGFFVLGSIIAFVNWAKSKKEDKSNV